MFGSLCSCENTNSIYFSDQLHPLLPAPSAHCAAFKNRQNANIQIQIPKYTNTNKQIHKYTNKQIQVHKNKYTNSQINKNKYTDTNTQIQIHKNKFTNIQIHKYTNSQK